MAVKARLSGIAPWGGMIGSACGFALNQQVVSDALHFDCTRIGSGSNTAWALLSLALVLLGAYFSWRARPAQQASAATLRRFVADMSLMAALLATLGIGFLILAGTIVPGCRP